MIAVRKIFRQSGKGTDLKVTCFPVEDQHP